MGQIGNRKTSSELRKAEFTSLHFTQDAMLKKVNVECVWDVFMQYCCTNTKTMYVDIAGDQENKLKKWNRRKTSILLFYMLQ